MNQPNYDTFKQTFSDLGYTRVYQEQKNLVVYTRNGIKCEIKKKHYTFGWLRSPEEIETIKETVLTQDYELSTKHQSENCVNILFVPKRDVLDTFITLVELMENIDSIVAKERGQAIKVFPKEVAEREIWLKIAKRYRNSIDNEDQLQLDNSRLMLEGDGIDHLIVVGKSKNYTLENAYREHVVPCILIHNRAAQMTIDGASLTEVANFIKTNLAIVLINSDEARKLDVELGLRTSMPTGWNWGDSIFARLKAGNIELI